MSEHAERPHQPGPSAHDREIARLQEALSRQFQETVELLVRLLELGRPGSAERGQRLATAALRLAARFEVPEPFLGDLVLAARLHEIGMLVDRPSLTDASPTRPDAWRYLMVSKTVLTEVEGLKGVADLVGAIRENWDGSGYPAKLQRGQIPFRSRILHVLVDFHTELDRAVAEGRLASARDVVAQLGMRAGTWYDSVIVGELEAIVGGSLETDITPAKLVLSVGELAAGMVLAEDLRTSSGVKLLSRGIRLTRGELDVILQRHQADPILTGAWVLRSAAG